MGIISDLHFLYTFQYFADFSAVEDVWVKLGSTSRFHLNELPRVVKLTGTESRSERRNGGFFFNGYRVSVLDDANGQQRWLHTL